MPEEGPEVLVVDDETRLADLFAVWLSSEWDVATAYGGEEALSTVSDSVEVVLLDRRMPGRSGDEILEAIREAGYDCRVVMITAVDPGFDVLGMGFDDYLIKPVDREELLETVENVSLRSEYEAVVREYYSLSSKKALIESEKSGRQLADNEEYAEIVERVAELDERVDETLDEMTDHGDFVGAFQDLPGGGDVQGPDLS